MNDLLLDYAMIIGLFLAVGLIAWAAFHTGYQFGHQDGYRQGVHRGSLFGRLKAHENRFPNRDN